MQYTDIGIDLGTASILVYIRGKGVVLKEPSVVAFDRDTNKIKAIGEDARLMLGRTPGNIVAVRPLRQGVISDYTVTEKMMKYFIQKALGRKTFRRPRIAVCVPSGVTEVEKKAVEDATYQAGAREVSIIEEPIAAAIGAGIDISRPCGNMIVDIGGGTSDIAVISLGGTVVSASIKIAGDAGNPAKLSRGAYQGGGHQRARRKRNKEQNQDSGIWKISAQADFEESTRRKSACAGKSFRGGDEAGIFVRADICVSVCGGKFPEFRGRRAASRRARGGEQNRRNPGCGKRRRKWSVV